MYGSVFKVQMFNRIMVFTSDRDTIRVNIVNVKSSCIWKKVFFIVSFKEVLIEKNYPKADRLADLVGFPLKER